MNAVNAHSYILHAVDTAAYCKQLVQLYDAYSCMMHTAEPAVCNMQLYQPHAIGSCMRQLHGLIRLGDVDRLGVTPFLMHTADVVA